MGSEPGADYINANYIDVRARGGGDGGDVLQGEASGTKQAYLATQGCLKVTIVAFWQMVWQEDVKLIAMTTDLLENGKVGCRRAVGHVDVPQSKCAPYWPQTLEAVQFGKFLVEPGKYDAIFAHGTGLNPPRPLEQLTPDYVLRRFILSKGLCVHD